MFAYTKPLYFCRGHSEQVQLHLCGIARIFSMVVVKCRNKMLYFMKISYLYFLDDVCLCV